MWCVCRPRGGKHKGGPEAYSVSINSEGKIYRLTAGYVLDADTSFTKSTSAGLGGFQGVLEGIGQPLSKYETRLLQDIFIGSFGKPKLVLDGKPKQPPTKAKTASTPKSPDAVSRQDIYRDDSKTSLSKIAASSNITTPAAVVERPKAMKSGAVISEPSMPSSKPSSENMSSEKIKTVASDKLSTATDFSRASASSASKSIAASRGSTPTESSPPKTTSASSASSSAPAAEKSTVSASKAAASPAKASPAVKASPKPAPSTGGFNLFGSSPPKTTSASSASSSAAKTSASDAAKQQPQSKSSTVPSGKRPSQPSASRK